MAISAGRLTQMISVLNPVLTRNAAGEMTEEWVSCGKIHADIRAGAAGSGCSPVRKWRRRKSHLGTRSVWS